MEAQFKAKKRGGSKKPMKKGAKKPAKKGMKY